jgi:hypothetical protein
MGTGINNPVPVDFKGTTQITWILKKQRARPEGTLSCAPLVLRRFAEVLRRIKTDYTNSWTSQATKGRAKQIKKNNGFLASQANKFESSDFTDYLCAAKIFVLLVFFDVHKIGLSVCCIKYSFF